MGSEFTPQSALRQLLPLSRSLWAPLESFPATWGFHQPSIPLPRVCHAADHPRQWSVRKGNQQCSASTLHTILGAAYWHFYAPAHSPRVRLIGGEQQGGMHLGCEGGVSQQIASVCICDCRASYESCSREAHQRLMAARYHCRPNVVRKYDQSYRCSHLEQPGGSHRFQVPSWCPKSPVYHYEHCISACSLRTPSPKLISKSGLLQPSAHVFLESFAYPWHRLSLEKMCESFDAQDEWAYFVQAGIKGTKVTGREVRFLAKGLPSSPSTPLHRVDFGGVFVRSRGPSVIRTSLVNDQHRSDLEFASSIRVNCWRI